MLGRTDSRARLLSVLVVFVLAGGALVARLGYWQISERERLVDSVRRQISVRTEIPPRRGTIYDRSGTVVLAESVTRDRLIVSADRMDAAGRDRMVAFLTEMLSLDAMAAAEVRQKLETGRAYLVIARDLPADRSEAIRAAADARSIGGVTFESEFLRSYPVGGGPGISLAAQLLGFVDRQGEGQYGVEQYYQEELAGKARVVESDRDTLGRPLAGTERTIDPGVSGADLRLTLDLGLQLAVEQEVMATQISDNAAAVSAVVMDPYTGEIYAEASYPSYDANDYRTTANTDPNRFIDPVVSQVYEPGSVFKMFTAIAALEAGTVSMATEINDSGTLELDGGQKIADYDHKAMGVMRFDDGIANSRNVVAAKVALGLAPDLRDASLALHTVWDRFGFGAQTGIDVAGEVRGLVTDPAVNQWRQIDLANGSFGQGVAVTQIQLAAAYAAMVNGGTAVQPHVVATIDGRPVAPGAEAGGPVATDGATDVAETGTTTANAGTAIIGASMSRQATDLLHHAVVTAYKDITIPDHWLGGKTGTAQIWDAEHGRWLDDHYNYTFVGYVGRREGHPDLIVAVWIANAKPTVWRPRGMALPTASQELFRRIASDAVTTPDLLPALPPETAPMARAEP
ncbi:MAG TPA: penicillin-binding protein 2 [Candidatus Eisenbacteria bacterium]|nr:penicillin-binding protein 2 [Candidatus Eisenbacteria bacterium]